MRIAEIIRRAVRHPDEIIPGIVCLYTRRHVKRVERDGEVFHEYGGELYPDYLTHGNAAANVLGIAQEYCAGAGIDIGANQWPFPGATPIDDSAAENAHSLDRFPDASLDYVFSSHCLEHLAQWQDALRLWIRKLRPGGILFLYLPHESCALWRPGAPWVGGAHKWSPTWQVLVPFLQSCDMDIVDYNDGRDRYWSFHIVGKRKSETAP